jgi:2-dehydropantoate 2-reductase
MKAQQHVVFGAGLIGGFVTGGLLNAGYPTWVVARPKARQAMAHGLKLTDYLENSAEVTAPNFIVDIDSSVAVVDVLWLTVKCTGVAGALDDIARLINPDTIIICCQNGFGSDAPVRQRFANNKILGAVIGYNVAEPKAGHLHRSTEGQLVIENDAVASIESLIENLNCNVFPSAVSNDFPAAQWAKLQLNLANSINALADVPVKTMLEQRGYRRIIAALMKEMLAVTDARKLDLPKVSPLPAHWLPRLLDVPNFLFRLLAQKMLAIDPSARTSMWWDLHNKKPTEIDFLNAAVVSEAQKLGLIAPVNNAVVDLVHAVERGEHKIGFSAASLNELLLNKRRT